jgi:hypothetical protein
VTSFFEEPPQQPRERHVPPLWSQPPANELGVAVPLRAVLARTADVAIIADSLVHHASSYSFGAGG